MAGLSELLGSFMSPQGINVKKEPDARGLEDALVQSAAGAKQEESPVIPQDIVSEVPEEEEGGTGLAPALKRPSTGQDFSALDKQIQDTKSRAQAIETKGAGQKVVEESMRALAVAKSDPAYTAQMRSLEDRLKSLDEQQDKVKGLAADKETKIEWLQALENIGQAMTQYAAARYGLDKGVNMAGLKMQKGDWQSALDRSFNKMKDELDRLNDIKRETLSEKKGLVSNTEDVAKQSMVAQREAEKEKSRMLEEADRLATNAEVAKINSRQKAAAAEARGDKQGALVARQEEKRTDDLLKEQARTLASQKKGLLIASGLFASMDDMTKKDRGKAEANIVKALSDAGIDPGQAKQTAEYFWEKSGLNPEKGKAIIDTRLSELEEAGKKLEAARVGRTSLGNKPSVTDISSVARVPSSAAQDPKILDYAKQNKLDYEKAKTILVGRGYKPVE